MASKEDMTRVEGRLDGIAGRLDKTEHLLLEEQKRDIEQLKARVKRLEDAIVR
jgi:hypothetical protein